MGGQGAMKKRIPYAVTFAWMLMVMILAFFDGLVWRGERKAAACHDGYVGTDRIYLTENTGTEGVLYVADFRGKVQDLLLSSSLWAGSSFAKLDYEGGLYCLLEKEFQTGDGRGWEYRVVQFDDQDRPVKMSPILRGPEEGTLTGFQAEPGGYYLTFVMDGGEAAGACLLESGQMADLAAPVQDGREEPLVLEYYEVTASGEGHPIIEARYENGAFLLRREDGAAAAEFEDPEEIGTAFACRSLSAGQLLKLRKDSMVFYIQLLLAGYVVLLVAMALLRNRSHTAYTIAIVEAVLFLITATGAISIPRIQKQAKEEEARRFGLYYVQALAQEIGSLGRLDFDGEGLYDSKEYGSLKKQLSGFINLDPISEVFADICVVRSSDHKVLASASGRNGQKFEQAYTAKAKELVETLASGDKAAGIRMVIDGNTYQALGTAASGELHPEYLLMGITVQEPSRGLFGQGNRRYLLYAGMIFIMGSVLSIWLLVLQGRELKRLAKAMEEVAGGRAAVVKGPVHGRDVDFMWNSLLETQKTISRINYTRYRIFESCYRFAPKNIEKILGRDSITEVKGGDMVLIHGTVAVVSSAEPQDSSQASADVMNRFIALAEKHQEDSGGFFVSGYSDLTLLKLLFLEESRSTVDFGVSFMHEFQEQKGLESLRTGILLHYSQYVYGIAGTDRQSFPFLLSGEIRELEKYAQWFQSMGLKLVMTEEVKNREKLDCLMRYIGYILIPDINQRVRMYEVLDACSVAERSLKAKTDPKFQKALQLFYQNDFYLARSTFSDVLKEDPADSMAKWYLFTCEKYLNEVHVEGDVCRLCWEERFTET